MPFAAIFVNQRGVVRAFNESNEQQTPNVPADVWKKRKVFKRRLKQSSRKSFQKALPVTPVCSRGKTNNEASATSSCELERRARDRTREKSDRARSPRRTTAKTPLLVYAFSGARHAAPYARGRIFCSLLFPLFCFFLLLRHSSRAVIRRPKREPLRPPQPPPPPPRRWWRSAVT